MKKPTFGHKYFLFLLVLNFASIVFAYVEASELSADLLCLNVFILGASISVYLWPKISSSIKSYSWVPCPYNVINVRINVVRGWSSDIVHKYEPEYEVEYRFKGRVFRRENDLLNLHLKEVFNTLDDANIYAGRLRSGLYGKFVYVNPKRPEEAYIRRGVTRDQIGTAIFSLLLIVFPVLTYFGLINWHK